MSIRLGYQIANFTYPGAVEDIFPTVVRQAQDAERSGFDTVLLMDHFYQLPGLGAPGDPMLEAYTTLGALSGLTSNIQLSTLVTGNTYRNPSLLAKTVTTLDVVSGGRAVLALGAGWFELEHQQMGFDFGTISERFERLEESLQIVTPMLRGEKPDVEGRWYRAHETLNSPQLRTTVPLLLGGGGEKKTFRLAAKYADHMNIIAGVSQLPAKMQALEQRCEEEGRDPATLEASFLTQVIMDPEPARATQLFHTYLRRNGIDPDTANDDVLAAQADHWFVGTPDAVAEQIHDRVMTTGVQGLLINMVMNGHESGMVQLAAETFAPLVT
ncbi:LLM class F420-dependent oxidoreductase [Rhodococcus erythropolis]|uniref:LLM class F420-dependent oxidoreductase n=1 Tax=Rhodococcus erythropolis TaxID=1833 RepID=UPI002226EEB7|nr:LLM class F420-dependent oxidoreductase [Rhodococcus erythropolis]MCW2295453.1 F420-dependent oxidoreductase-like protein [Rhodococcus erythropolis]